MSKRILGVGSPLVDVLSQVSDEHVQSVGGEKGGMEMVDFIKLQEMIKNAGNHEMAPGGSAANTILGLLKLGYSGSFLGKIGKDERGDFFMKSFTDAGGCHSRFKVCNETPTGTCLSLITPDAERTLRPFLGAAAGMLLDEVTEDDFKDHDHVHIEGYLLFNRELALKTLKAAKAAGCTVSLDLASFEVVNANKDVLPELLGAYVDMVFANEEEAKAWCDSDDPEEALRSLAEHCNTVAVKLGAEGAWVQHGDQKVFVDAHSVNAVDTTGAGDLWASGFLYGLLSGLSPEQSAKLASKVGAEVVQIMGASIPDKTWDDIREFLKNLNKELK
ncbi:MAG: adenosine kinase [Lentisphaeraceae bacterium]|nr:adenosine kinase [Lentisphaeraceae bacterium]